MSFEPREKARIKHHASYPDWVSLAQSMNLGYPAGAQPLFLIEDAFNRLTPDGEESVRIDLCECESIEVQMREARGRFRASELGKLKTNPQEIEQLRGEMLYWVQRLVTDLGVVTNPYGSFEYTGAGGGGRNARVG